MKIDERKNTVTSWNTGYRLVESREICTSSPCIYIGNCCSSRNGKDGRALWLMTFHTKRALCTYNSRCLMPLSSTGTLTVELSGPSPVRKNFIWTVRLTFALHSILWASWIDKLQPFYAWGRQGLIIFLDSPVKGILLYLLGCSASPSRSKFKKPYM